MENTRVKIKSHPILKEILINKTGTIIKTKTVKACYKDYDMYTVKLDEPVTLEVTSIYSKTSSEVTLPATCFEVI